MSVGKAGDRFLGIRLLLRSGFPVLDLRRFESDRRIVLRRVQRFEFFYRCLLGESLSVKATVLKLPLETLWRLGRELPEGRRTADTERYC